MKKFLSVLLATAFFASGVQAQIVSSNSSRITTIREEKPKAPKTNYNRIFWGYAPTKPIGKINEEKEKGDAVQGFEVGWTGGYNVTKGKLPIYFETGLNAIMGFDDGLQIMDFELPFGATYRYKIGQSKVYLAPYFGFHLKFNAKYGTEAADKIVRFGMQLGANFDISKFYIGIGWDRDLTPVFAGNIPTAYSPKTGSPIGWTEYKEFTSGARVRIGVTF